MQHHNNLQQLCANTHFLETVDSNGIYCNAVLISLDFATDQIDFVQMRLDGFGGLLEGRGKGNGVGQGIRLSLKDLRIVVRRPSR